MGRVAAGLVATGIALASSGCDVLGSSEIVIDARNDSDAPMVVQVVAGNDAGAPAFGPTHTLGAGEQRELELAVPGGNWTVTVNGALLFGSTDAADRRGRLPVTLLMPDTGAGPQWLAPVDWVQVEGP